MRKQLGLRAKFQTFLISLMLLSISIRGQSSWFEFLPVVTNQEEIVNFGNRLDKPAGIHGFVQMKGENIQFEDGKKVKFWGVNICSERPYFGKDTIDQWVDFLSKYCINAVRFHKFTQHALNGASSTALSPLLFEKFDYFHYKLKNAGIYSGWSPIYGHKIKKADKSRLLAYNEIEQADLGNHLSFSTIGLVNFAEDLQDLHASLLTSMLNHKNKYTGIRYADDPALIFIEIQNEDDIFFATTDQMVSLCPTYKKLFTSKFCKWLKKKYVNHDALLKFWGLEALKWGEEVRKETWNLDLDNITPVANQGIFDYEYQKAHRDGKEMPVFLLDMLKFLYEEQSSYYQKIIKAIRASGYKGMIVGSCWQAGSGISHFYNLYADYQAGIIDRHNYYGGGTGHQMIPGKFDNSSMLTQPGLGLLSTGMQMVSDRPFSFSEWMSLPPNEWIAEASPIVAAYGMGLQGWDASFAFASDFWHFTPMIHTPGVYNVTTPSQIALYPALASMVYQNEIKEGDWISQRNVCIESLEFGKLGFHDLQFQDKDKKEFGGIVTNEALAVGKVGVTFNHTYTKTEKPDLSKYFDLHSKTIKANNGQLVWNYADKGYFYVNTEYSKGFTGFAKDIQLDFNQFSFSTSNEFAVVWFTPLEKNTKFKDSKTVLISCMARAKNSGMITDEAHTTLLQTGNSPIILEAVDFKLHFKNKKIKRIEALDHLGRKTGKILAFQNNAVKISGSDNKTIDYLVEFF